MKHVIAMGCALLVAVLLLTHTGTAKAGGCFTGVCLAPQRVIVPSFTVPIVQQFRVQAVPITQRVHVFNSSAFFRARGVQTQVIRTRTCTGRFCGPVRSGVSRVRVFGR